MSTPSEPRPQGEQGDPAQPSTQEIPVVVPTAAAPPMSASPLPPHPGATAHAPVAATATPGPPPVTTPHPQAAPAQPTGPVNYVPGPPGHGTPQPSAVPAGATAVSAVPTWPDTLDSDSGTGDRPRTGSSRRDPGAFAGIGLALLGLALLELGLLLAFGSRSLWSAIPLWSAFATLAGLAALLVFGARSSESGAGGSPSVLGRAAVAGGVGVAVFWLLVVLPDAASNRGFVLTAAAACLGAGVWIGSRRTR